LIKDFDAELSRGSSTKMGFGDISHFNRVFRRRFGAPLSRIRETATWARRERPSRLFQVIDND